MRYASLALSLLLLGPGQAWAQPSVALDTRQPTSFRHELSGPQLPSNARHRAFLPVAARVDGLLRSGRDPGRQLRLDAHNDGNGESIYVFVVLDGKRVGMLMPPGNAAGNIEAEANAWSLFRLFGHEDMGQPCGYVTVGSWGQQRIRACMQSAVSGPRAKNREKVEALMQANAGRPMRMLFKYFDNGKPRNFTAPMVGTHLNDYYHLTVLLGKDSPPPEDKPFELEPGLRNNERFLTRQFATGLVVDTLQGEYDRWGGTNLHLHTWHGKPAFAWYDNGGAEFADNDPVFKRNVYKFEPPVVQQVRAMDDFLTGASKGYLSFRTPGQLRVALNLYSDEGWTGFQRNLHMVRGVMDERVKGKDALLPREGARP